MLFQNPRKVMFEHLTMVRAHVTIKSGTDKKNAEQFQSELERLSLRHTSLSRARVVVFLLLYASVVSAFASDLPVLGALLQSITALAGLVGVGILSILALYITWRMTQMWNHMLVLYGHLIAIYEKHNVRVYSKTHKKEV